MGLGVLMVDGVVRVDLHVHTRFSYDSAAPVGSVLRRCGEAGLGLVAVTDHNSIRGGLAARELGGDGVGVVVGEEIKSAQGDVIGLFLEEVVPGGLSALETVRRVKGQGGLVGIPHPFDRVRPTAMGGRAILEVLEWVDFLEGFNGHTLLSGDNRRGAEFALECGLPVVSCSDSHSALELGGCYTEVPGGLLDGTPEGLMRAIRAGRGVGRRAPGWLLLSPVYGRLRKLWPGGGG